MVNPVVGVTEQHWVRSQGVFDTFEAFTSSDATAFIELAFEGGNPEWHPSAERVGTASLQTEIQGRRSGTWNGSKYVKPNAFGTLPDFHALMRAGMGRQQIVITVADYTQGAGDALTFSIGGANTVLTEGVDFAAATSNDVTAAAIAAEINSNATLLAASISASVSAAVVTISIEDTWLELSSSDVTFAAVGSIRFAFDSDNVPAGLQIMKYGGRSFCEIVSGAWVETIEVEQNENEEGMLSFSGGFARKAYLYGEPRTDNAGHAGGTAAIQLDTGDGGKISVGMRVQFRRVTDDVVEDNAGAGYEVLAVDVANETLTLATNLANALSAEFYHVEPFVPAHSISGTILGGINCGFSIAATQTDVIGFGLTIDTGVRGSGRSVRADRVTHLSRGKRAPVEGSADFQFLDASTAQVGLGWSGTTQAVVMRHGDNVSAQRASWSMPSARIEIPTIETPEEEEATYSATIRPRQGSAFDDELVFTLD